MQHGQPAPDKNIISYVLKSPALTAAAKCRSEVNDNIMAFKGILDDVYDGRFAVNLPSVFKVAASGAGGDEPTCENPFETGNLGGKKGKKRNGEPLEGDNKATHNSISSEFKIKHGESWQDVLCGDSVCHRVKLSGEKNMCHRWF